MHFIRNHEILKKKKDLSIKVNKISMCQRLNSKFDVYYIFDKYFSEFKNFF